MGGERLRLKDLEKKKSTQSQKKSFTTALRVWYSTGGRILPPRSQASARTKRKVGCPWSSNTKGTPLYDFGNTLRRGKFFFFSAARFFKEKVDFGHDPHSKAHCVRAWSGALRCLPETTLPPAPGLIIPSTLRMVSIRSYIIKWGKRGRSGLDFLRKN